MNLWTAIGRYRQGGRRGRREVDSRWTGKTAFITRYKGKVQECCENLQMLGTYWYNSENRKEIYI